MSAGGLFTPNELTNLGKGPAGFFDAMIRRITSLEASVASLTGGDDGAAAISVQSVPALYKSGLITSPSLTTITVGIGACAPSSGSARPIALDAPLTKALSGFSSGGGNGGLTSALLPNTWWHIFVVDDGGETADVIFDTSAVSPAVPAPFSRSRRIGSFLTDGSSQITAYSQNGNQFGWSVPVLDVNVTNPGTSAVLRALTVPAGIISRAIMSVRALVISGGGSSLGLITSPASADTDPATGPSNFFGQAIAATNNIDIHSIECDTNTSAQIRTRISVSTINNGLTIYTFGWYDYFGETP